MPDFYIRGLELISIISEEWGEVIKEINDYHWKYKDEVGKMEELREFDIKLLNKILVEINQIDSPLLELKQLVLDQLKTDIKGIKCK